ncbi:MAG: RNase adapter RapZ [Gammaproteobacteria bacterium]|nr:RNase adapter RapZ [Gammaproteobacteria bacterium]MCP5135456.1 RNase adapter RapZ [Gammaproteobacteria bacterium]
MKFVIVSGLSGAGKSVALATIEDLGYYAIDNLPVALLRGLVEQVLTGDDANRYARTAVGIDARNTLRDLEQLPEILAELRTRGIDTALVFLHADEDELLKRFSETRRKHPLTSDQRALADAVTLERTLLEPLMEAADLVIDTTGTNQHQLRDILVQRLQPDTRNRLSLLVQSFGFKHGVPTDVDFVFDVRCLPNPHWEPRLRALTGRDPEVVEFLEADTMVHDLRRDIEAFLERWVPSFESSNRTYLTVAIGCTGGQHRSVYLAERIAEYFRSKRDNVILRHREMP